MGNDNPARVLVSPKDVADDIEFIEVVRATITRIVNLHRKKQNNNALKQRFFQELSAARDAVATEDEELYIGDVDILSEYISSDLMDQLMSEYSDEEIMSMYAEWEGSPAI